jgi:DNA modification methylase
MKLMNPYTTDKITLHNTDCLVLLASLPDNSVDLIATDPPYFKVKKDQWDNQWATQIEFLAWLEKVLIEYARVLRPTGSLYLFASPQMSTQIELLIAKHFKLLNHIIWCKPNGRWLSCRKESLRKFFPQTEHILFAESQKKSLVRRPFRVTKHVPYTNVWAFKPIAWYPNKHPCEKPLDLMRHIINASSNEGDVVLDTFAGSGSTALACHELNRKFIGCELGSGEFASAINRLERVICHSDSA